MSDVIKPLLSAIVIVVAIQHAPAQTYAEDTPVVVSDRDELSAADADAIVAQEEADKAEREANRLIDQISFVAVARKEVRIGGRKLVMTRVVPPRIPARRDSSPVTLSPIQASEIERRAQVELRTLFLSATVYDRKLTELRWWHEGREYTAWSNIDFNDFVGVGEFEAGNVVYSTLMAVTNQSVAELPGGEESEASLIQAVMPDLPTAGDRSVFVVTAKIPANEEGDGVLAPIDALHAYYDVNAARLRTQAQRNEALQDARERYRAQHPAQPADTRIYFWPVRGSAYQGVNR